MRTKGAKALLKYDGITVLEHQIQTILSFDKSADILIVVGFESDKIIKYVSEKEYDVRILYNHNYQLTSQSESWRLAVNCIRLSDYYIIHGDIIFNRSILKTQNKSTIMIDKYIDDKKNVGVCHQNGLMLNMSYGFVDKWAQLAYISKQDYTLSKNILNSFKTNKMTFEVLNMISSKSQFSVTKTTNKTLEINRHYEDSNIK
jgi:choline kinase